VSSSEDIKAALSMVRKSDMFCSWSSSVSPPMPQGASAMFDDGSATTQTAVDSGVCETASAVSRTSVSLSPCCAWASFSLTGEKMGLDGGRGDDGGKLLKRCSLEDAVMVSDSLMDSSASLLRELGGRGDSLPAIDLYKPFAAKRTRKGDPWARLTSLCPNVRGEGRLTEFLTSSSSIDGENNGLSPNKDRGVRSVRFSFRFFGVRGSNTVDDDVYGDEDGNIGPEFRAGLL